MANPTTTLRTEILENGVSTIIFGSSAQNSMPSTLLKALENSIVEAGQNPAVKVILLKSEGERTFCAGASFDELLEISAQEEATNFFSGFANVINAMRKCPKIIVLRVQGKAVGGGVGLAAAADYCIASQFATIRLSELNLGFGPFVIGAAVERKIGLSAFNELTINAVEWRTADWAKNKGLFNDAFETNEQADLYARRLAEQFVAYSPEAVVEVKKMLWHGTENWDELLKERAEISAKLLMTDYAKNALAALKGK